MSNARECNFYSQFLLKRINQCIRLFSDESIAATRIRSLTSN